MLYFIFLKERYILYPLFEEVVFNHVGELKGGFAGCKGKICREGAYSQVREEGLVFSAVLHRLEEMILYDLPMCVNILSSLETRLWGFDLCYRFFKVRNFQLHFHLIYRKMQRCESHVDNICRFLRYGKLDEEKTYKSL